MYWMYLTNSLQPSPCGGAMAVFNKQSNRRQTSTCRICGAVDRPFKQEEGAAVGQWTSAVLFEPQKRCTFVPGELVTARYRRV